MAGTNPKHAAHRRKASSSVGIGGLGSGRWKDFRALRLEALRTDPAAFGSSHSEEVKMGPSIWKKRMKNAIFALEGSRPVGMVSVVLGERVKQRHIAYIYGVYVTPRFRGKGIGNMLMERAMSIIEREPRIVKVELSVNPKYARAVNLYRKAGFVTVGKATREIRVGDEYHDLLLMEKQLVRDG